MYDIVGTLDTWNQARPAVVARAVALHGFGARTAGEAFAISADGETAGLLLEGTATAQFLAVADEIRRSERSISRTARVTIADVMLQTTDLLQREAWDAFRSGRPFVLASVLDTDSVIAVESDGTVHGTFDDPALQAAAIEAATELLAGAMAAHRLVTQGDTQLFVECFVPVTHLLVIGDGILADALTAQASLLGWESWVLGDDQAACEAAVARMHGSDVLALLSHNRNIDAPILAAAIRQGVGYVGGLGSRGNQSGRRGRLQALGLTDEELTRYRGPIGLDIGAANPAETAVAVCAEAISVLRKRAAAPLTATTGPINA